MAALGPINMGPAFSRATFVLLTPLQFDQGLAQRPAAPIGREKSDRQRDRLNDTAQYAQPLLPADRLRTAPSAVGSLPKTHVCPFAPDTGREIVPVAQTNTPPPGHPATEIMSEANTANTRARPPSRKIDHRRRNQDICRDESPTHRWGGESQN